MQGQLDMHVTSPAMGFATCMTASCAEPAITQLEGRRLCLEHFAGDSLEEIESRRRQLQNDLWNAQAAESFRAFLASCALQARELLDSHQDTVSPAKDRLLDLLLLTSHLNQHLRRSSRSSVSILVWLRREDPGQTWEEETWTSSISLHGAGLMCRHRVEPGQTVFLCRKDKGGRARARIVYAHFDSAGDRQIGLEILDRDDFWTPSELERASEKPLREAPPQVAEQSAANTCATRIHADVEIQSGNCVARYRDVPLDLITEGDEVRVSGVLPLELGLVAPPGSERAATPPRIAIVWKKPSPQSAPGTE